MNTRGQNLGKNLCMALFMEEYTKENIKVLIVGNEKRKNPFLNSVGRYRVAKNSPYDYVGNKFMVSTLAGTDSETDAPLHPYCLGLLDFAKVIIYLDASPVQKVKWEKVRDQSKCIAIDFDEMNILPSKCFPQIENLIAINMEKDKADKAKTIEKGTLLLNAHESDSAFKDLPKELISSIGCLLFSIKKKTIFEALPIEIEKKEKSLSLCSK